VNYVEQAIIAVEASAKVIWPVFFACLAVIGFEFYFSELFVGLPMWVMPIIRIVSIFTLVLCVASMAGTVLGYCKKLWTYIIRPFKKRSAQKTLLELGIAEVFVISTALAKGERTVRIKPDLPTALTLQDKGLIKPYWSGVVTGDGLSSFEVPQDVWRVILSMEEFRMSNPSALVNAQNQGANEATIKAALPQGHPSVRSQ